MLFSIKNSKEKWEQAIFIKITRVLSPWQILLFKVIGVLIFMYLLTQNALYVIFIFILMIVIGALAAAKD